MTVSEYFMHYITPPESLIFFGIAFGCVALVNIILYLASITGADRHAQEALDEKKRIEAAKALDEVSLEDRIIRNSGMELSDSHKVRLFQEARTNYVRHRFQNLTQRFYELVFSGNCILFFMTVYYLIFRFYNEQPYKSIFDKYNSFWLLLLIILSCVLNSFLDKILIKLDHLTDQDRAAIRILGMLYMLIIFAYIKYIYGNDNYDMYITYFLGIMIGRFVYFDASFKDFAVNAGMALKNLPVMLLALGCTALLAYYGFTTKFLIKHIGVVTNVYISHIFLIIAIFIIYHIHPEKWIK